MWDVPGMATTKKNAAAVALGRLGGLKGGQGKNTLSARIRARASREQGSPGETLPFATRH